VMALQGPWVKAQLTVDNSLTPTQLVEQILVGQGVSVSNVTFNGVVGNTVHDQMGAFNGTNSALGLNTGIVLATGRVPVVTGPNLDMSASLSPSIPHNQADPDLQQISTTIILRDQAILEFDFVPIGDTVSFRFVFASEEYPEYVCSMWNDVFGFFLSGPGINGSFSNNAVNLALVPGSPVPITINTVNGGSPGVLGQGASTCAASDPNWQSNAQYYVNNAGGSTLQMDGFTVPLAVGARVQCGQTYHIKIALSDAGDASVDSGVFLEGGSFSSTGGFNVNITTSTGDGTLTEGCGTATVTVQRNSTADELIIALGLEGAGVLASELAGIPPSIVLPAGTASGSFTFSAVEDGQTEGGEQLYIVCSTTNACGSPVLDSVAVTLLDHVPIELNVVVPELTCEAETVQLVATASGGLGLLEIQWSNGSMGPVTTVPGLQNATYTVSATDGCPKTVSQTVQVVSGCELDIPNVITPNQDGANDAWVIDGIEHVRHTLRLYNRWGQVLLETENYGNNWKGDGASDGTYFYVLFTPHDSRSYTGTLTVLGGDQD
ncbi:MAG TPA: choice-of-anchor L domain-containing protein, partial [Flavobacteriales bacterium]|nr:choice-of-anchor L domain-containing protein [Flavobacteriales bacterium]